MENCTLILFKKIFIQIQLLFFEVNSSWQNLAYEWGIRHTTNNINAIFFCPRHNIHKTVAIWDSKMTYKLYKLYKITLNIKSTRRTSWMPNFRNGKLKITKIWIQAKNLWKIWRVHWEKSFTLQEFRPNHITKTYFHQYADVWHFVKKNINRQVKLGKWSLHSTPLHSMSSFDGRTQFIKRELAVRVCKWPQYCVFFLQQ